MGEKRWQEVTIGVKDVDIDVPHQATRRETLQAV
jgi:hypothetical protein